MTPHFPKTISLWSLGRVWFMQSHLLNETAQKNGHWLVCTGNAQLVFQGRLPQRSYASALAMCLNSYSVTGHVLHICLLEWWALSYPESLPCLSMGGLWSEQHLALFQKREWMEIQKPFTINHDFQSLWLISEPHSVHFTQILSVKPGTTLQGAALGSHTESRLCRELSFSPLRTLDWNCFLNHLTGCVGSSGGLQHLAAP